MNLKLMLAETVKRHGKKTAIVAGERRLSYAELDEASNKIANALIAIGVSKGDRVAMLLPNSPEFVIIYFGISKAGGIAVPLDTRYKVGELASLFASCRPKVLVADSPSLEPLVPALPKFKYIEHVIDLNATCQGQFLSYGEIMATASSNRVEVEIDPADTAYLAYTSGPVLHPRGVMVSQQNLLKEVAITAEAFQQSERDVVMLFALPLHHAFGQVMVLLVSFYKGSTLVMVPGTGLSISSLMEAIEREKGTVLMGVPYIFALANKVARREGIKNDLSSLRLCGSGGAPLSLNVIKQFKRYYGCNLIDFWGLTEAVAVVTCPPLDGTEKLGAVGKAMPGWEIKIVDDSGNELLPHQRGEVIVRGPIMSGYYHNPQATAEAIKGGWLYTGDMGSLDEDGYLFLSGRKKEMIILKGQNIYPSDVEQVLSTYPKIAAVKVFAIPDKLRGEIVGAVIHSKKKVVTRAQEVKRFCQERMADYKLPKRIVFTSSLSKFANAKIGNKKLKDYLSNLPHLPPPLYKPNKPR